MSPTLRSKLAGWICSSNIGVRATILPVEIRSWISWEGSTPAFTPRVEAASSGKRPCSEVRASRGILVLRLLAFRFSLRGVGRALLIRVGKRWCSSRGYRSRLRSCVRFLPGYLVGWSCRNLGRGFGPTIRVGLPVLILTRYWRLLLATILSYLGTTDQNAGSSCVESGPQRTGFYSFSEQPQSAGGTCAFRKSATRLYASI